MNLVLPCRSSQKSWTAPGNRAFQHLQPTIPPVREMFASRMVVGQSGEQIPLDVYIPELEAELLYSLVRYVRPHVSLEIGLANGVSTVHMVQALEDNGVGHHVAIDPYQYSQWKGAGIVTLQRAGLGSRCTLDCRPSHCALPDLEENGTKVQFAFVDGSHLFDYVMTDFLGIDRILEVGGLIAFDDSDWPAIASVIRFALTNRSYEVFPTGQVVEPQRSRPRLASRGLRLVARACPPLNRILRHDFVVPNQSIGVAGRLVVLRKRASDRRDGQSRHFVRF